MTIHDIAKTAGVSPSTVSKVINQKDSSISEKTRQRVLKVIEESNYIPYAGVRGKLLAQNNLIALVVPSLSDPFFSEVAGKAQYYARQKGYPLTIQSSFGISDNELFILHELSEAYFSGLLIFPHSEKSLDYLSSDSCNLSNVILLDTLYSNCPFPVFTRDYSAATELGVSYLLKHEHRRIAFALRSECSLKIRDRMVSSYKAALASVGLPFDESLVVINNDEFNYNLAGLIDSGVDAILCQDSSLVGESYKILNRKQYGIPEDVSVLCLEDNSLLEQLSPAVTSVKCDVDELASLAVDSIIMLMSGERIPPITTTLPVHLIRRDSVRKRANSEKKIVVAGGINMYVTVNMQRLPKIGETVIASGQKNMLGGKGANLAHGVSRFGADAFIIGKLGNDVYGKQLFEWMVREHIDVRGLSFEQDCFSGTVFINTQQDGQVMVIANPGANSNVTPEYIEENRDIFTDARYCIVQMGIHLHAVEKIVQICNEMGIKVILKPSAAQSLTPEILDNLFLLIPNREEANHLLPEISRPEDQARSFLDSGVENVIITLGEEGSLYASVNGTRRYPAADFPSVNPAGGSDVFISCLAVQLIKGHDMDEAIRLSTIAASYSVSKEGMNNTFIDPELLEHLGHGDYSLQALEK